MIELRETWVLRDGSMVAEGDASEIADTLAESVEVARTADGWTALYRNQQTGEFWELSYPQSHLHGGGPRKLLQISITNQTEWRPSDHAV